MRVQILVDNKNSWILPYAEELKTELQKRKHETTLLHDGNEVVKGDILCLLSCENLFKNLNLNKHNLVVHESTLPEGKGWSPLTWQILEGKNTIPITLFEAAKEVDSGVIYLQDFMHFKGHELIEELRAEQGKKTNELILKFVDNYQNMRGESQSGPSTYYKRRTTKDSELDIHKSIKSQFELLRVSDNTRYPAWFTKDGHKYYLKIEKAKT